MDEEDRFERRSIFGDDNRETRRQFNNCIYIVSLSGVTGDGWYGVLRGRGDYDKEVELHDDVQISSGVDFVSMRERWRARKKRII